MRYFCEEDHHQFDTSGILPQEPFYLKLKNSDFIIKNKDKLLELKNISNEVFLSMPADFFDDETQFYLWKDLGIKGIVPQFSYDPIKWNHQIGFGDYHSGDRDVVEKFKSIKFKHGSEYTFGFEITVQSEMRILPSTLSSLAKSGASLGVLDTPFSLTEVDLKKLKDIFQYLKIRNLKAINIYFPFWIERSKAWNLLTENTFSGLEEVHIDISNKCTHSCVFCGLYGSDFIEDHKAQAGGVISDEYKKIMSQEADEEKTQRIIKTLPWTVKNIQFGGLGDPLMHKRAIDFITLSRERGFKVEILSNMEYLKDNDILRLHKVGGDRMHDLHFVANISGGDVETYLRTRPRQTEKTFHKIKENLKKFRDLRQKDGKGVFYTIMCVVNKYNSSNLSQLIDFAHEVGASRVWFKPIEVHHPLHRKFIPQKDEEFKSFSQSLKKALMRADSLSVELFERHVCEKVIEDIDKKFQ